MGLLDINDLANRIKIYEYGFLSVMSPIDYIEG